MVMALNEGQRKILSIIDEKADHTLDGFVFDIDVIRESGLPEGEARGYLDQLKGMRYIEIDLAITGANYRLINLTEDGLLVTSEDYELR
jgi:hypothetical protein